MTVDTGNATRNSDGFGPLTGRVGVLGEAALAAGTCALLGLHGGQIVRRCDEKVENVVKVMRKCREGDEEMSYR